MLRFWSSEIPFWRKSRTKASFLSFVFEGSLAELLRFWSSKLQFWSLKEVSQKSLVLELQSFIFEGSLAEMLRFWCSKLHFWRKSRRKASFLIFKALFLKEVSHKRFVFELQNFNLEGSLAELLPFWSSKLDFWRKSRRNASFWASKFHFWRKSRRKALNLKSMDNQITWIPDQLTTNSLEVQINKQPKSFEAHINWQPNHLKLKSIDNQLIWISNQLTTKITRITHRLTTKSFESQIDWQPNHLTFNSFESDINWLSNQLNSAHSLPIGSLSLETSATALCGRYVKKKMQI